MVCLPQLGLFLLRECSEKLVLGRLRFRGQRSVREAGIQGSGKVLRHCFWTCSFSWSPPDSHHSQAGEDRDRGLSGHRDGPVPAHRNLPPHRNLSICRNLSSHSDLSSCRELPPTHATGHHPGRGHQFYLQQPQLQVQVSPGGQGHPSGHH